MDLEKRADVQGEVLTIHLVGELTGPETAEFKSWAGQQIEQGPADVRIDCRKLHFIDSSGLGSLVYLRKKVVERAGTLRLVEVSGWLRKFLQVTGLEDTFGVSEDRAPEAQP